MAAKTKRLPLARVLLIDDDNTVREATEMLLDGYGFEVVAVSNGPAGVEAIKAGPFHLVIVDLFMPGMDGLETTEAIREVDPLIPVIAVSGFMLGHLHLDMPNFDAMAVEAGAVSTLYKPFRPDVLLNAVRRTLGQDEPQQMAH